MLRRLRSSLVPEAGDQRTPAWVRVADASFPRPVPNVLEFNAPVHENWNIVHTGMLMPECHQIYVCADNCLRGVVLTAAEMGASERLSSVVIEEADLLRDNLESVTIEGVSDVLRKLTYHPRAVMVFLVCLHHFVGTDVRYVYAELERRFPRVRFLRCWMDPIMQKTGITPEQRQRRAMAELLDPVPQDENLVGVLSDDLRLPDDSDLARLVRSSGRRLMQLHDCARLDDYLSLGASSLLVTRTAVAAWGLAKVARRLERPYLYLPPALDYEAIDASLGRLAQALGVPTPDTCAQRRVCDAALDALARRLAGVPVAIDALAVNHPLELARLLLEHGLDVRRVYLDVVSDEERGALAWLRSQAPDLELWSTVHPTLRQRPRADGDGWLAVGPKAAWFVGTSHVVNVIETDGHWGYEAILHLVGLMERAWATSADIRSLVPRKGLGLPCACQMSW
ncbi:nitrogenase component 1 [Olsenella sp. HMSC062G07]|uniref:nitrogenase component 1 n=1 Tax=Olsenella sp. HMSC062G07 TaxID=1739330 RepID=UPI0008A25FB7|nr:nitrogenase component 1 [Olsenella sp. HMSC062G07]OFK24808.1 hypothetical protein HMPREF2826_06175 [Olsenella sp. HMSC062G07]